MPICQHFGLILFQCEAARSTTKTTIPFATWKVTGEPVEVRLLRCLLAPKLEPPLIHKLLIPSVDKIRIDFNTISYASNLLFYQIAQLVAVECLQTLALDLGIRNITGSIEESVENLEQPFRTATMKVVCQLIELQTHVVKNFSAAACLTLIQCGIFEKDIMSTAEYEFYITSQLQNVQVQIQNVGATVKKVTRNSSRH